MIPISNKECSVQCSNLREMIGFMSDWILYCRKLSVGPYSGGCCWCATICQQLESSFCQSTHVLNTVQSQIHDFPKEGARFRVKCHVDAIQWGGGVVAEFFCDLQNPMRFSGGGVVAEMFVIYKSLSGSVGGGAVPEIFR